MESMATSSLSTAPDAPPQAFTHSITNGSPDVVFQWAPPPSSAANGVITGYTLSCNSSNSSFPSTSELRQTETSLTAGSRYLCSISASTAVGAGPPSTPRPVLTGMVSSISSQSLPLLYVPMQCRVPQET